MRFLSYKGQMTVEMVLIIFLTISTANFILGKFKDKEVIFNFISSPWKSVAGMMESGKWESRLKAQDHHPNYWKRMSTQKGK